MIRIMLSVAAVAAFLLPALARESYPGQFAQVDPARREFFSKAMRPDLEDGGKLTSPCCGDADAYEADDFETDAAGNLFAILTCNDPENCVAYCKGQQAAPCREFQSAGTRIPIPPDKILPPHQPDNFTGHGWVFLAGSGSYVFCFAPPGGY